MNEQRLLLYCSQWQGLRVHFLKDYSTDGGWTTEKGTMRALHQMHTYVADSVLEGTKLVRLWRVINCLNAVRMGYSGQELRGSPMDILVARQRDAFRLIQESVGKRPITLALAGFDALETFTRYTAVDYVRLDQRTQAAILENLTKRSALHSGREELEWYLRLIRREGW